MNKFILSITGTLLFIGCAANNPQPHTQTQMKNHKNDKNIQVIQNYVQNKKVTQPIKKIAKYVDKPVDIKQVEKKLLKISSYYANKHKKEAIKETIKLQSNMPLYRKPLFAEMYVMPYVSNDGIYHDTQKVFIKIKKGKFVLNTKSSKYKNQRVFTLQGLDNEY